MKRVLVIVLLITGSVRAQSADSVYLYPDHPPVFPGSHQSLNLWLHDNLHFPDSLFPGSDDLLTKLDITFVVEKDGRLTAIRVNSIGTPEQNRFIAGIIKSMPRWQPGSDHGIPVRSAVHLPVNCLKYD